jgi:hypothetical protein
MRPGRREGVEGEIHRDLTTLARNKAISDALVVSGEEDLAPVIGDVQDIGVRVFMAHITVDGNWTISRSLRQECDDIVELTTSHLRPYVELISGAEPARADEQDSDPLAAVRQQSNGHAPGMYPPAAAGQQLPAIYTAPAVTEYQRIAPAALSRPAAEESVPVAQQSLPGGESRGYRDESPFRQDRQDRQQIVPGGRAGEEPRESLPTRSEPPSRQDLPARAELPARTELPSRAEPPARTEIPSRAEIPSRTEMPSRAEIPSRTEIPSRAELSPRAEPAARQEQDLYGAPVPALREERAGVSGYSAAGAGRERANGNGQQFGAGRGYTGPQAVTPSFTASAPSFTAGPGFASGRTGADVSQLTTGGQPPAVPQSPPSAQGPPGQSLSTQPPSGPQPVSQASRGLPPAAQPQSPSQLPTALPQSPPAAQASAGQPPAAMSLADAVQAAHEEGLDFGSSVARDAPTLWLEAVLARKPRMPSDLEARLLQGSALPIDFLLHDEVRHALRRGFWDALERARR